MVCGRSQRISSTIRPSSGSVWSVHILLATDADWIVDEVTAALGDDDVHFTVCREGRAVAGEVKKQVPDLAILDLQVGSMGGMAVTMALRLDESAGAVPHVKVLMLLDRAADMHLARRSGVDAASHPVSDFPPARRRLEAAGR